MSAIIISGRKIRDSLIEELKGKVSGLSCVPLLSIIQVGDRPDSTSYIRAKTIFAQKIGVEIRQLKLSVDISESELIQKIMTENEDSKVCGIIVQLPLPLQINRDNIIASIDPAKDADGLTGKCPHDSVVPATARGVFELLKYYNIPIENKKVTVVGRSILVGRPIAELCAKKGAMVTVCHSGTLNLAEETRGADILIVATGKAHLIKPEHVNNGQVIIDVGISKDLEGQILGDVDFENVSKIVKAISPVPGGVGPMTVLALFQNLLDLCS